MREVTLKDIIKMMTINQVQSYDIFLSFADEDKDFALALCKSLEKNQISVWCSATHVPAGADIHAEVSKALPNCEYFVPIISKYYGRFWHEKEFHSGSHNRHNDLIIPVLYQTNYEIIEQNMQLFSLISSIRPIEAMEENINEVAQKIIAKIKSENNIFSNKKTTTFKTILSEKILHNKIAQITIFTSLLSLSCISVYDYISSKEMQKEAEKSQKIREQEVAGLTDTLVLKETAILKTNSKTTQKAKKQDDKFALKIQNVVAEKQKNDLTTLHFTIKNRSDKSLFFNAVILEVNRDRGVEVIETEGREIANIGIWEVLIPQETNTSKHSYKASKAPSKIVKAGDIVQLSVVLFQEKANQKTPPITGEVMRISFVSSENFQASSRDFYFDRKGEFVYDE